MTNTLIRTAKAGIRGALTLSIGGYYTVKGLANYSIEETKRTTHNCKLAYKAVKVINKHRVQ